MRFLCGGLFVFCLTAAPQIAAQNCPPFDRFLERLNATSDGAAKTTLADELAACARREGAPLIGKSDRAGFGRAIFLYRGPAKKVTLAGDMNRWTQSEMFTPLGGTDLFYLSREYELDARLDYKFVLDGKEWIFDPWNPRRMVSGFGSNSYFAMPGYVVPPELEPRENAPHGAIEEISFASKILGNTRAMKVYLPPGYASSQEQYGALYVHDGTDYLNFAKINEIVDVMIRGKEIPPLILVLVPPVDRNREYWNNADFARAFATELVPFVDRRYRTKADASSRALLGASLGGLISLYIAGHYPDVFVKCAGQSSAVFPDSDFAQIWPTPKGDTRFHLDIGTYEEDYQQRDLLNGNRRLLDFLQTRGYGLQYREVHEGHSWGSWRARIPEALRFLWGASKPKK